VVEADRREDATNIAMEVQSRVAELLQQHCSTGCGATTTFSLNEDKTTAKPYSSISKENNVSALMELYQEAISGTFDLDSLIQATGGLDGLLWLSEQLEDPHSRKTSPLQLANIAVANTDVRDDTVKRFAATRIASTLRMRLAMTDTEGTPVTIAPSTNRSMTGAALNHEFEATARKLIKCVFHTKLDTDSRRNWTVIPRQYSYSTKCEQGQRQLPDMRLSAITNTQGLSLHRLSILLSQRPGRHVPFLHSSTWRCEL
jgi:hypothetical protein